MSGQSEEPGLQPVHAAWNLQGTPEEEAEFKRLLASIDRKLDAAEKRIDKVLIRMGIDPRHVDQ